MVDGDIMYIEELCKEAEILPCPADSAASSEVAIKPVNSRILIIPGNCNNQDDMPKNETNGLPNNKEDYNYKKVRVPNWVVEGYEHVDIAQAICIINEWSVRSPESFSKYNKNVAIESQEVICPPEPSSTAKCNPKIEKLRKFINKYNDDCNSSGKLANDDKKYNQVETVLEVEESTLGAVPIEACLDQCTADTSNENDLASCGAIEESETSPSQTPQKCCCNTELKPTTDTTDESNTQDQSLQESNSADVQCLETKRSNPDSRIEHESRCSVKYKVSSCLLMQAPAYCSNVENFNKVKQEEEDIPRSGGAVLSDAVLAIPLCRNASIVNMKSENTTSETPIQDCSQAKLPQTRNCNCDPQAVMALLTEPNTEENSKDPCCSKNLVDGNAECKTHDGKDSKNNFICPAMLERLRQRLRRSGGQSLIIDDLLEDLIGPSNSTCSQVDTRKSATNNSIKYTDVEMTETSGKSVTSQSTQTESEVVCKITNSSHKLFPLTDSADSINDAPNRSISSPCNKNPAGELQNIRVSNTICCNQLCSCNQNFNKLNTQICGLPSNLSAGSAACKCKSVNSDDSSSSIRPHILVPKTLSQARLTNALFGPEFRDDRTAVPPTVCGCSRHCPKHAFGSMRILANNHNYLNGNITPLNGNSYRLLNRPIHSMDTFNLNRSNMRNLNEWPYVRGHCCHYANKNFNSKLCSSTESANRNYPSFI